MFKGYDKLESLLYNEPIFPRLEASIEAISFQANSKFPIELKSLIEKIFTYSEEMAKKYGEVTDSKIAYKKHSAIKKYIESEISDDLKKVIKKNTGLEINEVYTILPLLDPSASTFFACRIANPKKVIHDLLNLASAESNIKTDRSIKSLKDIFTISDSLDRSSGKILKDSKSLRFELFIPVGPFCLNDLVKNGDRFELTSDEIVAIILHEIGHEMAWVETAADMAYLGYYGNNFLREINTYINNKNNKNIREETIEIASDISNKTDNKAIKAFCLNSISLLSKSAKDEIPDIKINKKEIEKAEHQGYKNNLNIIIIFLILRLLCLINFTLVIGNWIGISIGSSFFNDKGNPSSSHEKITSNQQRMFERLADEYVSRFKMGKYLNSGLIKVISLQKYINMTYGIPALNKTLRESESLLIGIILISTPLNLFTYISSVLFEKTSSYEDDIQRLRRNVNNLIDVLKDSKLEANIRNSIIDDIQEMEKMISSNYPPSYRILKMVIDGIIKLPSNAINVSFGQIFGSGGLNRDYNRLMYELDELLSNRTFVYAAQAQRLFEKG